MEIVLIIAVVALIAAVVYQQTRVVIAKRNEYQLYRNIKKERGATADILTLSRDVVTKGSSDEEFLEHFIEYALRTLKGVGAAVLTCDNDGHFHGCAVAGTFPSLKPVSPQVEQQLMAYAKKHTEFIKGLELEFKRTDIDEMCLPNKYAFFNNETPPFFPESFIKEAPRVLLAPIRINGRIDAFVIITSKDDFDSHSLEDADGTHLVRLTELASLSLEVLKVFKERQKYEERLQNAREEGMVQVSTGIIHNIGNAITVAKLSIMELKEKFGMVKEERPETLIVNEIIPPLKKHLEAGDIQNFLSSDPAGSQYFDILQELLVHNLNNSEDSKKLLDSLANKLYHISEIIELQQRFVGELGTENMTHLSGVIESSIKIFEETFNKRGVKINTDIDAGTPEVLIDASMMTQVFMNLIKNAVEAIDSEHSPEKLYHLDIKLCCEELQNEEGQTNNYAVVEIRDNGPGIPDAVKERIFDFGFSTKGKESTRGYGLHSCVDTVRKYGGMIKLDSTPGEGTAFRVAIPVKPE